MWRTISTRPYSTTKSIAAATSPMRIPPGEAGARRSPGRSGRSPAYSHERQTRCRSAPASSMSSVNPIQISSPPRSGVGTSASTTSPKIRAATQKPETMRPTIGAGGAETRSKARSAKPSGSPACRRRRPPSRFCRPTDRNSRSRSMSPRESHLDPGGVHQHRDDGQDDHGRQTEQLSGDRAASRSEPMSASVTGGHSAWPSATAISQPSSRNAASSFTAGGCHEVENDDRDQRQRRDARSRSGRRFF